MPRPLLPALATVLGLLVLLAGCADDGSTASASASGSGSLASGSGSLAEEDLGAGTDDPLVEQAVRDYTDFVAEQVDLLVEETTVFTDAVRAGDLAAAQAAYAPSREPWERIEPIAGLVSDIDGAVDARVDDFDSATDPDFTGWHRLEHLIFAQRTTDGAAPFADRLDADLATLQDAVADLEIPPAAIPVGASELIEEVSLGKITGEEDRYSKTDLWDFAANVEGSRAAVDTLAPALEKSDEELLTAVRAAFDDLGDSLEPLRRGDGWAPYCQEDDPFPSEDYCPGITVDAEQKAVLTAQLAELSERTAEMAGALGLQ